VKIRILKESDLYLRGMESAFSPGGSYFGNEHVYLIIVDGTPLGYIPVNKGSDVFTRLITDKKGRLEQDLGHSVNEIATTDDKGGCTVILESPTRSYVWGGMRTRCKLELRKISILCLA
jgi:hypothetical protein